MTFSSFHSFFKGRSCWVSMTLCKKYHLAVKPTRMEQLKNESDAARKLHILQVKGKQQHTDCNLYLRNGLQKGI